MEALPRSMITPLIAGEPLAPQCASLLSAAPAYGAAGLGAVGNALASLCAKRMRALSSSARNR
eukprot:scaffold230984_cov31-Tisochrysis_lutea.AAC.1